MIALGAALALVLATDVAPPPPMTPQDMPTTTTPPQVPAKTAPASKVTTPLMAKYAGKITAKASTSWPGWEPERLIDGDPATSWFSAKGDSAAHGKKPWVEVTFPADVVVKSVRVLGNVEPSWPKGFTIRYGVLELLDANHKVIAKVDNEGKNAVADVDFILKAPVSGVRSVRFTSLFDEGKNTPYEDIALAEILVE